MRTFACLPLFLAIAGMLLLSACGKNEYVRLKYSESRNEALDGEDVEISGNVKLWPVSIVHAGKWQEFYLTTEGATNLLTFHEPDTFTTINVSMRLGHGKNRMRQLPRDYEYRDLDITDKDGRTITFMDSARVRGELEVKEGMASIYVDEIEKLDRY